jgi:hypothetical protein
MLDAKTIVGAVVVIVFTALAATYSRQALWSALVVSLGLYLLLVWRDWFGDTTWPVASTITVGLVAGVIASATWWFFALPFAYKAPRFVIDDGAPVALQVQTEAGIMEVAAPRRVLVNMTAEDVIRIYETNTTAQADRMFNEAYKGQWLRLRETVHDVRTIDRGVSVQVTLRKGKSASLTFGNNQVRNVSHLQRGDQVSAICRMSVVDGQRLVLSDCEIR